MNFIRKIIHWNRSRLIGLRLDQAFKRLQVTRSDIVQGERYSQENCPVARAVSRAIGNDVVVRVRGDKVTVSDGNGGYWENGLDISVQRVIEQFDETGAMQCFGFESGGKWDKSDSHYNREQLVHLPPRTNAEPQNVYETIKC